MVVALLAMADVSQLPFFLAMTATLYVPKGTPLWE